MRRAALYVRVSSQGQVRDGYSLQFQEQILREFCQREGLAIAGVYRDGGASGSTSRRKDLQRLIADARLNRFEVVLIFRVDRFSRDPVDLLALVRELEARNIKLRSVTEAVDASDPAGELMLTILGAIGKFVRQNIIQNAMLGKTKRAEAGRYTGGRVPFGYVVAETGEYKPDPQPWWNGRSAAEVAGLVFGLYTKMAARGAGCLRVARELNAMGVPGPRGVWGHSSVYQLLTNPCYAGDFTYNRRSHQLHKRAVVHNPDEWVIVRGAHVPIVDRLAWDRVQQLLKTNKASGGGRPPQDAFKDLITGFLRCGECGAALTPRRPTGTQRYLYYTCCSRLSERRVREGTACTGFPWLRAGELEGLIWGALVETVADRRRIAEICSRMQAGTGPELSEAQGEVRRLEQRLANLEQQEMALTTAFSEGKLREHLWQKQLQRLEAERQAVGDRLLQLQSRLAELRSQAPAAASAEDIQEYLKKVLAEGTTLEERREALAILVGPRGIRVQKDGTVDFDIKIPLHISTRQSTAKAAFPSRPAP